MTDILCKTKALLHGQDLTLVLNDGSKTYTSRKRGVAPLLELYENGTDVKGFVAADKVVGKAAAFLYVVLGVKEIYADVISEPSLKVLARYGIDVSYGTAVCGIRNRTDTGPCPMENAVKDIDDPIDALNAINRTLVKLMETK